MAALAWALAAVACGAGGLDTPAARTAQAWAHAVAGDDPRAAYDLLSDKVRSRKTYDTFVREWKDSRAERARQAAALGDATRSQRGETARVSLPDGLAMRLTREAAGWRLEAPLLPARRAGTPEEALRLFAQALEDRSFTSVVRLLTTERREGVRQVLDSFVSGLRAHLKDSIEVTNDRATLIWTDGSRRWRVVLKREQGGWRIDDFTQQ